MNTKLMRSFLDLWTDGEDPYTWAIVEHKIKNWNTEWELDLSDFGITVDEVPEHDKNLTPKEINRWLSIAREYFPEETRQAQVKKISKTYLNLDWDSIKDYDWLPITMTPYQQITKEAKRLLEKGGYPFTSSGAYRAARDGVIDKCVYENWDELYLEDGEVEYNPNPGGSVYYLTKEQCYPKGENSMAVESSFNRSLKKLIAEDSFSEDQAEKLQEWAESLDKSWENLKDENPDYIWKIGSLAGDFASTAFELVRLYQDDEKYNEDTDEYDEPEKEKVSKLLESAKKDKIALLEEVEAFIRYLEEYKDDIEKAEM